MTNRRKMLLLALCGLLMLLLAACAGAAAEAAEFPYGRYKSRGGRHLEFMEEGTWTFALVEGQPIVYGEIAVDGREITFGDETPAEGQNVPLCADPATYRWTFEEEELTLEAVGKDPCDHRAGDLGATFFPVP